MSDKAPSPLSLVLIPAILTLIVSVVRLVGEINGWSPALFARDAGGSSEDVPGLLGIAFLAPIFGFWFGLRLRRATGQPAALRRAAMLSVAGLFAFAGGVALLIGLELIAMPDPTAPKEPKGTEYLLGVIAVALALMFAAWPRLALTTLVYALLARIPVVAITWLALQYPDWNTHYTKIPDGLLVPAGQSQLAFLVMPQLTVWIAYTVVLGGIFGLLGAALGKPRR